MTHQTIAPTIAVRIHRNDDDHQGVVAQLLCVPRIGETISIPDDDGVERDTTVTGVNYWIKFVGGRYQQAEVVIFCV